MWGLGVRFADDLCGGWKTICGGGGRLGAVYLRIAIAGKMAVERSIIGFHQDEFGDWVADLDCGHGQHTRHNPPWTSRPWVTTEEGRKSRLGSKLVCKRCAEENAAPQKTES